MTWRCRLCLLLAVLDAALLVVLTPGMVFNTFVEAKAQKHRWAAATALSACSAGCDAGLDEHKGPAAGRHQPGAHQGAHEHQCGAHDCA